MTKDMNELDYNKLSNEVMKKLRKEKSIVLATCADNRVMARMVSHINDGLTILFSTGRNNQKAEQIRQNPNIAFAIDNLKIEAVAEFFGHPGGHPSFLKEYQKKFPLLVKLYPSSPDDLLIIAKPIKISLYKYLGRPCEEVLETDSETAYRLDLS